MKINQGYVSIDQIAGQYLNNTAKSTNQTIPASNVSFEEILRRQAEVKEGLKFSKHADNRLAERNISLTGEQMQRLTDGTNKARQKGIQESLVLVDELAFIVNIKNNTVVTAMNQGENDAIFTNIDGAVII